jgi:hypothetical protein
VPAATVPARPVRSLRPTRRRCRRPRPTRARSRTGGLGAAADPQRPGRWRPPPCGAPRRGAARVARTALAVWQGQRSSGWLEGSRVPVGSERSGA